MPHVLLESETDWAGWRKATRALVLSAVPPGDVRWTLRTDPSDRADELPSGVGGFNVPRSLVDMAALAFQAREPERFGLLYGLIWRVNAGETLDGDSGLRRAQRMALAVRAEAHRMRTNLRFLPVKLEGAAFYLGWYAPSHFVLESNAQLLSRRFPQTRFAILTPDGSTVWDSSDLRFGPAVVRMQDDAALADWWRTQAPSLLSESRIGTSVPSAEELDEAPRPPDRPAIGPVVMPAGPDRALLDATFEAGDCRRCHLYEPATQTVFGEGPAHARVIFVGEQPGDQEDVIGRPFVGPAGQMLDRALEDAGIDRRTVYVTNAVKHFKFTPRGKRRIHQTPDTTEIAACKFWLDVERVQLRPELLVLMGGSAARAVLNRAVTIGRERGRPIRMEDGQVAFITVHPSFLLRVPDEDARAREYKAFVRDLEAVRALIEALPARSSSAAI